MTTTPYSDQWRERTKARMKALGVGMVSMSRATGLSLEWLREELRFDDERADYEIACVVDEYLAGLESHADARALRGELVPVAVDLDALTNLGACVPGEEQLRAGRIVLG
jgi:lambda repressor-like predicted transcriptional regulator